MAANNKEYVTVLYTNISKAFDFLHPDDSETQSIRLFQIKDLQ